MPSSRPLSLALVASLAAIFSAASCSRKTEEAAPAASETASNITLPPEQRSRVVIREITSTTFARTIDVTGTVAFDANRSTQVISPISGPVTRLLVELGTSVRPGESLATVSSPDFAADVSAFRKADVAAKNLRRIADLDTALFDRGGIARRDMEQAQADASSAESDREAALEQLHSLGLTDQTVELIRQGKPVPPGERVLKSPIAGIVVERLITAGQLLTAGSTPCFTVADLSTMWVMASVFEHDLPYVKVGDSAEIQGDAAGPTLSGRIDYIGALVDPATRAIPVRVVAANSRGFLRKDMYVRVRIRSGVPGRGFVLPASAILRDTENLPFVYRAQPDGSFARRRVTLGARVGDGFEITEGVASGDRIAVDGGLFMQFAQSQ